MKWISVKDQLPKAYQWFLIYGIANECQSCCQDGKTKSINYGIYNFEENKFHVGEYSCRFLATHWLDVQPPKD